MVFSRYKVCYHSAGVDVTHAEADAEGEDAERCSYLGVTSIGLPVALPWLRVPDLAAIKSILWGTFRPPPTSDS